MKGNVSPSLQALRVFRYPLCGLKRRPQGLRIIKCLLLKMASSRENGLSETHASMLHAFCACNSIRLPLTRQHKTSVSVSRFAPLRHFQYKLDYNAEALSSPAFFS